MLSRERVAAVIEGKKPDRMPIYGWVKVNLREKIDARFGSVEDFEDHYEFDLAHLFGGPRTWPGERVEALRQAGGGEIEPPALLDVLTSDPNDEAEYQSLREQIDHHQRQRGRFVYVQTPGIFEALNGVFGIENHLAYTLLFPDELKVIYRRQAEWNRAFAMNCLDLGVDMVHVSDDWGAQRGLLFSPDYWREMIRPFHRITADAVRQRGGYLSLHSDGNINAVIDGVVDLGFQVVHPWQESAGMSFDDYLANWRDKFVLMGGLDVQDTIGFGDLPRVEREIRRVVEMFSDGGLIFCTTHFVQEHCGIDELVFAYDLVHRLVREA